jgi:hypothetical protein
MPYLSVDEFKYAVLNTSLDLIVQQHIVEGVPYAFRDTPEAGDLLTKHLCKAMGFSEHNVVIVGSAKVGYSLNPDNFPRGFSDSSDIDVVVVSPELFDRVWMTLLSWHYPRRLVDLGRVEGDWARLRRKDIYWGWLVPDEIRYEGLSFPDVLKPLRDISTKWFNTFQSLSLYPEFAARKVSGRLYRTWDHVLRYHMEGLRLLRERIQVIERGV